ncbi:hypothetical protein [Paraburkholderia tagetis]|uniref:Uncharacterized protein n=1 Tax=Paraburkholderia tagetis TaxID=2913261 RepID=A0A9X1RUS6_9BURK|nr:hypothetical protein [Paraburkholderia tagetis]MCG5076247.1 hypothetical protein [Paraburkholderia tagetis]
MPDFGMERKTTACKDMMKSQSDKVEGERLSDSLDMVLGGIGKPLECEQSCHAMATHFNGKPAVERWFASLNSALSARIDGWQKFGGSHSG